MNKNITSLYVVNLNNRTVAFGSNLKELYSMFSKVEPNCRNYHHYYRKFKNQKTFLVELNDKEYFFQQLV